MQLFDTHCHIDLPEFDRDREQILAAAREQRVNKIIVPAITKDGWSKLLYICDSHPGLHPALGLHPMYLSKHLQEDLQALESAVTDKRIIAVGEIGLDFYEKGLDKSGQIELLDTQLTIAKTADLPVILHCRKAYDDLITLLTKHQLKGGIAHAFNGSLQQANKLINLGYKLGFGGMLTYQRSTKLRTLAAQLPLDSIVLETDSPFMTVAQYQGQRNSPAYLLYVLQALAEIQKNSATEVAALTYENALTVFAVGEV